MLETYVLFGRPYCLGDTKQLCLSQIGSGSLLYAWGRQAQHDLEDQEGRVGDLWRLILIQTWEAFCGPKNGRALQIEDLEDIFIEATA
jgi:hypothetical protein